MRQNWTQTTTPTFDRKSAEQMNEIARTVFAPVYPVIAANALAVTGIRKGACVEIGSGHGMLAIAIAREAPDMDVVCLDFSEDSKQIAEANIAEAGLQERIRCVASDVCAMPLEDGSAQLVVSRGSMFFWKDLKSAFEEIYRILAPGGGAYIGGGFGSLELKERIIAEMLRRNPSWDCYAKKKAGEEDIRRFEEMLEAVGCRSYRIIDDETGFWIALSKPSST